MALVVGLCVGALVMWIVLRSPPRRTRPPPFETDEPAVPAGVAEVLAVLNSAGVVVGPHDEVLRGHVAARTLGLVRGSRIARPQLLDLIRTVRREQAWSPPSCR